MNKSIYIFALLFAASTLFTSCDSNEEIEVASNVDNPAGVVINDIRWATRNVDYPGTFAQHPESAGRFFQWGTPLGGDTHHWAATGEVTDWNSDGTRVAWTLANNPCPEGWRLPTEEELRSLSSAGSVRAQRNGVNGRLFGTAPDQIFLPAVGWRYNTTGALNTMGVSGHYWSSTPIGIGIGAEYAMHLSINSPASSVVALNRANGFSVRCVAE